MARKAGPGNGAEDAPEGGAGPTPEESGVRPERRVTEAGEELSGFRSPGAEEARVEDLSVEGPEAPSSEGAPDDPSVEGSLGGSSRPEAAIPVVSGDDPLGSSSEEAAGRDIGFSEPDVPDASAGEAEPPGADPWRPDAPAERDGPDPMRPEPFLLTASAASPEETSRMPETPRDPARSEPPSASVPPPPPRRRGGFGGLLLGGMIAAALGFGAAWLAQDRLGLFPARLPVDLEERLAALEARPVPDAAAVQALAADLAAAEARLAALEEAPDAVPAVDLEPLRQELGQGLAEAQARAAELEERLAALEARPEAPTGGEAPLGSLAQDPGPAVRPAPPVNPEALREEILAALDPRLSEMEAGLAEVRTALSEARSTLDDLTARLDQAEAQSAAAAEEARTAAESLAEAESRAATAEAEARARAALGEVEATLAAGEPFEAPLSELGATGVAVPEGLSQLAAEGVPTLAALQTSFPEAARAGLAAARDQGLLDEGNGVMDFLRGQLSVRSVSPREGEDPDAVLSRAQAQLSAGQLDAALAELEALPEPVRAAMADWIAQAQARAQADAALAGLRDALPDPDAPPAD